MQFQDLSIDFPMSWKWDFDYDGQVPSDPANFDSFEQNPVAVFSEARPYQVLLEVCNEVACDSIVKTVLVQREPIFADGFESGNVSSWSGAAAP